MLNAILHGKGRRLPAHIAAGASLSTVFARSEDLLTATVFERLAYLDQALLARLLAAAFRPLILDPREPLQLEEIDFWPRWEGAFHRLGKSVEPDVVMRLTVGDPARRVVLIVECKLDGFQYPHQWYEEWVAFRETCVEEADAEVWLLAVAGLPGTPAATVADFTAQIRRQHGIDIRAAAASWLDLRKAIEALKPERVSDLRLIGDLREAFELHRIFVFRPMADLAAIAKGYRISSVAQQVLRWTPAAPAAPAAPGARKLSDLDRFRPIGVHPALRWRKDPND